MTDTNTALDTSWWAGSLGTRAELNEAAELYRRVFGYEGPEYTLNPLLLKAMIANGGSAVGVRNEEGALVGFAYGFAGTDGTSNYHYSQAAVVARGVQSKGIGRTLKLVQREVALNWGADHMRWTYDPVFARNGHFNLNSLGATGIKLLPDFYGTSGTDRLVVDWDLTPDPEPFVETHALPSRVTPDSWGHAVTVGDDVWVPIPAKVQAGFSELDGETYAGREHLTDTLVDLFARGYVAVSCSRLDERSAAYRLENRS